MPIPPENRPTAGPVAALAANYGPALGEWLAWVSLAGLAYSQTGFFDQPIKEYAFGASGWPRVLCLAVIAGASGQLILQILARRRGDLPAGGEPGNAIAKPAGIRNLAQRAGIFLLPLIYLYAMPSVGFYVATPVFVVCLLLLLEVRSPTAIATVTAVVCSLVLLVFTRLFFVALPTGSIEAFYAVNNAVISAVRTGM